MRTAALIRRSLVLVASLAAFFASTGPHSAMATGTVVAPSPESVWVIQGDWSETGATLWTDIDSEQTEILIDKREPVIEDMLIKVDSEYMYIEELINGDYGDPDAMVVTRGQNDSVAASHEGGTAIRGPQTVTTDVYVNDVTVTDGLRGFQIYMYLPSGVRNVQMIPDPAWLETYWDYAWCTEAYHGIGYWTTTCTGIGDPPGPIGSGRVARITLLPTQEVEATYTITLTATLTDSYANEIPNTARPLRIKVLKCPDANLDGRMNVGDDLLVALHDLDRGHDSGATLLDDVDASQTLMSISDQSLLVSGGTASIEAEQITVQTLQEGTPDTMTVVRGANRSPVRPHPADTHIYLATNDGNLDGKFGYTAPRDVNHDDIINVADSLIVARAPQGDCPAP